MKKELRSLLTCILLLILPLVGYSQSPNLGTASAFALFTANGAFASTGASTVVGDVGTNVGTFNAFPPGSVTGQIRLAGSTQADQAATDVTAAYTSITSLSCGKVIDPLLGNGQVLTPGIYCQPLAAASSLNGTLTLNGPGTYIIKLNSALTTNAGSVVALTNGACINDVYFQINGAVDLGTGSVFRGTILANGAISLASGATLEGRALSIAGAISISDNTVTNYAPVVSVAITSGATCNTATNAYDLTGTLSLTSAVAGTFTITDGSSTTTVSVTTGQLSVAFGLAALNSGTGSRTVVVTGPGCITASATYTAPASCTTAPTSPASLSGIVYTDTNTNGVRDGGEGPITGVVVSLLDSSSAVVGSTTTGPSGVYSFTGLTPGTPYSLSFSTPTGYSATTPTGGVAGPFSLSSGANTTAVNAGYVLLAPTLTLNLLVDKSVIRPGNTLTYTLVLTNSGNGPASNVVVRDSTTAGLSYVPNSATAPAGTTFTPGSPISNWLVPTLAAGQSLTLTFQATADQSGILYNTAFIPGDTVRVCTSVPVKLCQGDQYVLSVPAGSATYRWYKDGVFIAGQLTNELTVSEPGSYSLGIDEAGSQCPNFSCCPFIVEADTMPVFQAVTIAATCIGNSVQANGQIVLSGFNPSHTFQYATGITFDAANVVSGAPQPIPANGVIATNLLNPVVAQAYTVRVTNSAGCFTDVTVTLSPTTCDCPVQVCVPVVLRKTRGVGVR
ncbi:ice-binding family protein [Fibrella aquatica]|uniref:ice-binding family protein n=1 Tax=Fibrella aquatica TaxID=3242487 RepID=UPI003522EC7C